MRPGCMTDKYIYNVTLCFILKSFGMCLIRELYGYFISEIVLCLYKIFSCNLNSVLIILMFFFLFFFATSFLAEYLPSNRSGKIYGFAKER